MRSRRDSPVLAWYPAQVNTSIRPGWFYHENEDDRVRSLDELLSSLLWLRRRERPVPAEHPAGPTRPVS